MLGIIVLIVLSVTVLTGAHLVVKDKPGPEPHSIKEFKDYFIK